MKSTHFLISIMAVLMVLAVSCKKVRTPSAAGTNATSTPVGTSTPIVGPDAYEDDDTCGTAVSIGVNGATQTHAFDVSFDLDWMIFPVGSGTNYTIATSSVGTSATPALYLVQPDCASIYAFVVTAAPGDNATLMWTATLTGTVYLAIFDDLGAFGANTDYTIGVTSP